MVLTEFEKRLADEGYRPWGIVINTNPDVDPPGSKLFQYRKPRSKLTAYAVLTSDKKFVRGAIEHADGSLEEVEPKRA